MKRIVQITFWLLMSGFLSHTYAGQSSITGSVRDANDSSPISGATVTIKGTSISTSTDDNGYYSIAASGTNAVLVFQALGYATQEITVGNQRTIDARMVQDETQISEVVVTALGIKRSQRSLGYSAQSVNGETLNRDRQANVVNSLQGKAAGLTITNTGGSPGQGARIQIRGINSLDPSRDSQPLFVIDGVIMDNSTSTFGSGTDIRGVSNRAIDINPDDIESVNVLRGGAATALYGLRGVNGVIIINTKSGKSGSININYNTAYGFENVNKFPKFQNTYTQGYLGVYNADDFWPSFGPTVQEAIAIDPTHPSRLYNHIEDAFGTGQQFRNNLSISGGSDKVTFYSALSQYNHDGIIPTTDFKNYQARLNVDAKVSEKFSTGISLNYTNSGASNRVNAIRYNEQLIYWSPRHNVTDYLDENGKMKSYGSTTNPIYVASTNRLSDNTDRMIGNFKASYKALDWLDFNFRAGYDGYNEHRQRTAPGFEGLAGERLVSENGAFGANGRGFIFDYNTRYRAINTTFIANARHSFSNGFNGVLRFGHELYDRKIRNTGVEGADLAAYDWFDLRNAKILQAVQGGQDYRLMGLFSELTLDYKEYLYLTLTGRNDITSTLSGDNKSFFYPSATLTYIFSDNMTLPSYMNYGKLRFSYASMGKDADPYSTSFGYAFYTNLPTGYIGFTRPSRLGDANLRPEFVNTYEAGLDMSFLNNRLSFETTYYYILSKDQIINIPVSATTGYVNAAVNAGSMRNRGLELTINTVPVKKTNFTWKSGINLTINRNKILELRDDLQEIFIASQSGYLNSAVSMVLREGMEYGSLFGRAYQRYYTPDEISAGLEAENRFKSVDGSRSIVIGADGFPVVNPVSHQQFLGSSQPRWIAGWNNTLVYKDLTLNLLFDARIGQYRYNQLNNFYAAFGMADYTENRNDYIVFDGVLADGTPNTQEVWLGQGVDPKTGRNYGDGYYRNTYRASSEESVEDASWVRLRSATINYSLPTQWFHNSFIKNAGIAVTGTNLWLWTKYRGYDPEASTFNAGSNAVDGFAGFASPAVRSFLFTLNVGF